MGAAASLINANNKQFNSMIQGQFAGQFDGQAEVVAGVGAFVIALFVINIICNILAFCVFNSYRKTIQGGQANKAQEII